MSYRVKIESFEGPFELLLELVTRQKVKIASISISDVADQYLDHINQMRSLDLDVASEFLIVASTLLSMKAKALLPDDSEKNPDEELELGDLTVEQAADLLAERVLTYYQYKRIASMLGSRMRNEAMMHSRSIGPDPEFLGLLPDYLEGVTLDGLGLVCASLMARRETFLLDAEHIAAKPIAVETYIDSICKRVADKRRARFEELVDDPQDLSHVVVSFLAVLEMYKRGMIGLSQDDCSTPIMVEYVDPQRWAELAAPENEDEDKAGESTAGGDVASDATGEQEIVKQGDR